MRTSNVIYAALSICCFFTSALGGLIEDMIGMVTGVNITQKASEQNTLSVHATALNDERWKSLVEGGNRSGSDDSDDGDHDEEMLWFVLITTGKHDEFERLLKQSLNDLADELKDVSGVRVGRAEYDSDIRQMSTRWLLFQVPVYVLAQDKGQTLRFVSPYQIPPNTASMRKLLVDSEYKKLPVWSGRLSYNGDYAFYMDIYTRFSLYLHSLLDTIPSLVWYIGVASLSSSLLKWMHKEDKTKTQDRRMRGERVK
ncbi:hypothetical protein E3P77_02204 [Wallemia ichthyophaga]|nr:hypothetical protein E3P77_02204 [Wallemia ichthyophaga]